MKSLTNIAKSVADVELSHEDIDSATRKLIRRFTQFVEAAGGRVDELKNRRGHMYFEEEVCPLVEFILRQLARESGSAFDIMKGNAKLTDLECTHSVIQELLDDFVAEGTSEDEAQAAINLLDRVFFFSFRVELENCHRLLDALALNLYPQPYTYAMQSMSDFSNELKRMFAKSSVEAVIYCSELMGFLKNAVELADAESPFEICGDINDEITQEYIQRDLHVIEFLRENPDLRKFVERRAGCTVEALWKLKEDNADAQSAD